MDVADIIPLVSRWLHIVAVVLLVGGTAFLRWSIVPIQSSDLSDEVFELIRKRWSRVVMVSILFLLLSGLYNSYLKAIGFKLTPTYHALLGLKILLGFLIFFLASLLAGRSGLAIKVRAARTKWYDLTLLGMLFLICIAGYMKMSPQEMKSKASDVAISAENNLKNRNLGGTAGF